MRGRTDGLYEELTLGHMTYPAFTAAGSASSQVGIDSRAHIQP